MSVRISVLIPTRHRPDFIAAGLKCLAMNTYGNVEVIISDNWTDPALSCAEAVTKAGLPFVKLVRPDQPLDMVANWNFALGHATGDYVAVLTDKMFLLPGTLARLAEAAEATRADIINWVDDSSQPLDLRRPLIDIQYIRGESGVSPDQRWESFDPMAALEEKANAAVPRYKQTRAQYSRGKICFGAFSRSLIRRIQEPGHQLFQPISPDYTSMILGLSFANSAVMLGQSGIVHLNTMVSNGGNCSADDQAAQSFYEDQGSWDWVNRWGVAPGLYASVHHGVSVDYDRLLHELSIPLRLNRAAWLAHCHFDLIQPNRLWSSGVTKEKQLQMLRNAVDLLPHEDADRYHELIREATTVQGAAPNLRLILSTAAKRFLIKIGVANWAILLLRQRKRASTFHRSILEGVSVHKKEIT